jgi:hypothetical protein
LLSSTGVSTSYQRGIDVIAVSAEPRRRSEQPQADRKLERLPIACGLAARGGPFVSRVPSDDDPAIFNEPGRLLSEPNGTV